MKISQLQPGQQFAITNLGISGRLIYANESRARVRLDGSTRDVSFDDSEGVARSSVARGGRETDWAPSTEVEVEDQEMKVVGDKFHEGNKMILVQSFKDGDCMDDIARHWQVEIHDIERVIREYLTKYAKRGG